MDITLNSELERLIESQLSQGEYASVEELLRDALLNLLASKKRKNLAKKARDLFAQTQALPHLQNITDDDIAAEIKLFRREYD